MSSTSKSTRIHTNSVNSETFKNWLLLKNKTSQLLALIVIVGAVVFAGTKLIPSSSANGAFLNNTKVTVWDDNVGVNSCPRTDCRTLTTINSGTYWACWQVIGSEVYDGSFQNFYWAYLPDVDNGHGGFVNEVYMSGTGNNQTVSNTLSTFSNVSNVATGWGSCTSGPKN